MQCLIEQCAISTPASTWSLFLGWVSVGATLIGVGFLIWLLVAPTRLSFLVALGYGWSIGINLILKVIIRADRPQPDVCGTSYGMPSGHVQNATYAGVTLLMLALFYSPKLQGLQAWRTFLVGLPVFVIVIFIGVARVELGYHFAGQIAVGYLIGIGWGLLWSLAWLPDDSDKSDSSATPLNPETMDYVMVPSNHW